jgi:hypothetical protein
MKHLSLVLGYEISGVVEALDLEESECSGCARDILHRQAQPAATNRNCPFD